ncbi:FAD-dependent monooxygenase [Streptomyces microflavus]|uniref:FAD-dependent monooxygenase n=1 Tax=Streptomyces microflavus TaxID=1919 RepID=UPI00340BBBA0
MSAGTAVVSGASIAGLSAAFWLRRLGWQVTVIERAPEFRDGGQNIDVRGVAREVLVRMGLFDAVKARNTTETGAVIVDGNGQAIATLPDAGGTGATAELEILRGDLAGVLRDHLPEGVEFVYGDTIEDVSEHAGHARLTTAGGRELRCDLLVIAEGVRSTTRGRVFAQDTVEERELGVTMVFGTIPRVAGDDDRWRWYNAPGGRQAHLRPDPYGTTRTILSYSPGDDLLSMSRNEALAQVRSRYRGAGWETSRILDALETSQDVYIDQLAQIRMKTWHQGHVVMLGDAAWCVTPMGGGGASLALTSAYVLAAQLSARSGDLAAALAAYERWMRPLVRDAQNMPGWLTRFAYPQSRAGLALRHVADRVFTSAPFRPLAAKLTQVAETERTLPTLRPTTG